MDNFGPRFLGIVLTIYGVIVCIKPVQYDTKYKMTYDFTGINIPFGLFLVALGIGFIWTTYRKK